MSAALAGPIVAPEGGLLQAVWDFASLVVAPAVCGVLGTCAGCGECGAACVSADLRRAWHQIGWVSVVQVSRVPCCHATRPGSRGWLSFLVAIIGVSSA